MQSPLVSIITPCYKASATLSKTVESILAQTFTDWELLLVDDCSPDDTCDKAQAYCEADSRIHLIRQQKNGGAAVARNAGIGQARAGILRSLMRMTAGTRRSWSAKSSSCKSTTGRYPLQATPGLMKTVTLSTKSVYLKPCLTGNC